MEEQGKIPSNTKGNTGASCPSSMTIEQPLNDDIPSQGIDKQMDAYSAFASTSTPSVKRSLEKSNSSSKAISNSPLAAYLEHHNINRLVITGIATDVCVKATAEDALACGFEIILVREAMKGVDEKNSDRALEDFSTQHGATVVNTVHDLKQRLVRSI